MLDEPTSSLDLSVRAGILELLQEIRDETQAGFLFISHDLGTIKLISDEIAVLYLGRVVEQMPKEKLFEAPSHPYSQALLSAHLPSDPNEKLNKFTLAGEIPSPIIAFALKLLTPYSTLLKLIPRANYLWAWLAELMWPWPHEVHWPY